MTGTVRDSFNVMQKTFQGFRDCTGHALPLADLPQAGTRGSSAMFEEPEGTLQTNSHRR